MNTDVIAKITSYIIGILLMIALLYVIKQKQEVTQKKIYGISINKIVIVVIVCFALMILYAVFISSSADGT